MAYDAQAYLLDRANIHDTITKLCHAYDTASPSVLAAEVYAPEVGLDYVAFLGADGPTSAKGPEWSRSVVDILRPLTATQHLLAGVVADLPQPAPSSPSSASSSATPTRRPDSCRAVANVFATLVREGARGGGLMQNGGRYEFELVRVAGLEEQGRNPWRVKFHKAVATWENGNWAVFSPPDLPPIYNRDKKGAAEDGGARVS